MTVPGKILLEGVVGSTAYGLATENSDVDLLGLFAYPTVDLLGLTEPAESISQTGPDATYHEARKYCRLVLGCNPTAMELLWLPVYTSSTRIGFELVALRESFLSARRVRDAYLGYATQQFKRLKASGDFGPDLKKRTEKHARHLRRLVYQGMNLWMTGELQIKLLDPYVYFEFGRRVADGDLELAEKVLLTGEECFNQMPCALPERPDVERVQEWLLKLRKQELRAPKE